jgi:hypothetical protein
VRKQHDTRLYVLCKDGRGYYHEESFHISAQVMCGGKIFNLEDFAPICKEDCYIALPGQERELEKYLKKIGQQSKLHF